MCYNNMALAYGVYGTGDELYHNPALKEDILYGLDWFYKHRYGQAEIDGNGWRSTDDYNWWDWQIGTPRYLIPVLLIMENEPELTQAQIVNYLALFDKLVPSGRMTGSNLMNTAKLAIGSALLQNDPEKVLKNQQLLESSYLYVDNGRERSAVPYSREEMARGNGFYTDGSYVFHALFPMNGQYGQEQFRLLGSFLSMFVGTAFEVTTPQADNIIEWIENAFDPLLYQGTMFRMAEGRYWDLTFISGEEERDSSAGAIAVCGFLEMLDNMSADDPLKEIYRNAVSHIVVSLYENYSSKNLPDCNGLLIHAVYGKPQNRGVDECNIWGCYYYMEALARLLKKSKGYW